MDAASLRVILNAMRCAIFISIALLAYALATPIVAQDASGTEDTTAPVRDVAIAPIARDEQIATRISNILTSTGWYQDISVTVSDGIVFLDGETDSDEHRTWARDLSAKTQDVVAVVNRLDVESGINWSIAPALNALGDVSERLIRMLPLFLLALIVLPATWWFSSMAARGLRRVLLGSVSSPFLRSVTARLMALPIFLVGIYVVLQVAGLTQLAFSVVGGAGVIGIIVGFAFRDIAENFLASLLLSLRQPFRTGDLIEVQGMLGSVHSMNTRSTVLISPEGNHIQIPNSVVFKNVITNFTASPEGREQISVGIGYDASITKAQDIIAQVLSEHEAVLDEPQPMILVDALGSSTVNLVAYYWVNVRAYSILKVKSSVLRLVKKALTDAGISMPDDAREIIFPQGVPILTDHAIEQPAPVPESSRARTNAEAALKNDQDEITERAAKADIAEDDGNLLL